jgi:hypothetical protein
MKTTNNLLRGIFSLTLLCAIALLGCDNGTTEPSPTTYTVAFDGGDGSGSPPATQTATANTGITLPGKGSLIAPAGKEFDGWRAGGTNYATGDSYTVTGDVTFIAQWKTADPFVDQRMDRLE